MALGRFECPVRGLVLDQQGEGLVRVALVQPVERQVGDDVGDVSGVPAFAVPGQEDRVVVDTVLGEDLPVVEADRVALGAVAQVPLADDGCLVPRRLQHLGEGRLAGVELLPGLFQRGHSVDVAVCAGEQGRTGR